MRRCMTLVVLLIFAVLFAASVTGCGSGGEATSTEEAQTGMGKAVNQAESASCAANRRVIFSAAQSYEAMEGKPPASIQALVPGYLQSMPSCPSGGTYRLQGDSVTCSVHGS